MGAPARASDLANEAAVGVDDALHDGETQTHSLHAGGEKRLEQPRLVLRWDSGTTVHKLDHDAALRELRRVRRGQQRLAALTGPRKPRPHRGSERTGRDDQLSPFRL